MKIRRILLQLMITCLPLAGYAQQEFKNWPEGTSPEEIGRLVSKRFVEVPHPNFDGNPAPPNEITYPETCAWFGALRYADVTRNRELLKQLEERFLSIFGPERRLQPLPDHVDHTVFGIIPLQLYMQTHNEVYYHLGIWYADAQWQMPRQSKHQAEHQALLNKNLSWQTRYWIDDMFMITAIQSQAYYVTKDRTYIDRTAHEMVAYLDKIQRPNGLFYHAEDAPFYWGRGNGWMAAGMTELLKALPENNTDRKRIMKGYLTMMESLKEYQGKDGMWNQLVDEPDFWPETSGSAMFAYAIITGVKRGWLDQTEYVPVARKAWLALVPYIDKNGDVREVCVGTNKKNDKQYYYDRPRITGDYHGQAPYLWCATALLE